MSGEIRFTFGKSRRQDFAVDLRLFEFQCTLHLQHEQ